MIIEELLVEKDLMAIIPIQASGIQDLILDLVIVDSNDPFPLSENVECP